MGTMVRGFHSKTSSSTPNKAAATGVPNTAAIPAHAPATSKVRRSMAAKWKSWATIDPMAPPLKMMGPSAPKGPPVPMLTALEMGLSTARRVSTLLPPTSTVSMASGMPWPRMRSEPQ